MVLQRGGLASGFFILPFNEERRVACSVLGGEASLSKSMPKSSKSAQRCILEPNTRSKANTGILEPQKANRYS